MRRISTDTRDVDKHGTGRDGFSDEAAPTPATDLNAQWFDDVQEEIARTIELHGDTLSGDDFDQLARVVSTSTEGLIARGVVSGLNYANASGLTAELQPGVFWYDGRRYNVTAADITAIGTESPRTFATSNTTYVGIRPTDGDTDVETFEISVSTSSPNNSYTQIAIITTDGSGITTNLSRSVTDFAFAPHVDDLVIQNTIVPRETSGSAGVEFPALGSEDPDDETGLRRYWKTLAVQHRFQRPLAVADGNGRVFEHVITRTISNSTANHDNTIHTPIGFTNDTSMHITAHVAGHRTDQDGASYYATLYAGVRRDSSGTLAEDGVHPTEVDWGDATPTVTIEVSGSDVVLRHVLADLNEDWTFTSHVKIVQANV